jgi:TRAP-type C4-dicarboxylate transport system substrate-binding protein
MNNGTGSVVRSAATTGALRSCAVLVALMMLAAACGGEDAAGGEAAAGGTPAATEDADYSYSLDLAHYTSMETALGQTLDFWAREVEERAAGDVDITIHANASLVNVEDSLTSVRDGRADIAFTATLYHQADLPLTTVTEIPFLSPDANAQVRAIDELYQEDEDLQAEFHDLGLHLLQPIPASVALFGSPEGPLTTMEQLRGLNIRAVGSSANVVRAAGGNPIAITFPEIYESLERGVIDAFSEVVLDAAVATGLYEAAPYLSDPGIGPPTVYPLVIQKALWDDMPEDLRTAMREASEATMDEVLRIQREFDESACDQLLEDGGSVSLWDDAEAERLSDALGDDLLDAWRQDAENAGLDADAFLDRYLELLEQYEDPDHTTGTAECAARS